MAAVALVIVMPKRYRKRKTPTNVIGPEGRHAVAAIDPGGTTGVFCAVAELRGSMLKTAGYVAGTFEDESHGWCGEITGDFRSQAAAITNSLRDWFALQTMDYVAPENHHVVIENWDTMRKEPGREIVSAWIAAGIDCLLTEGLNPIFKPEQITYFMAGQAKGYATNTRLKLWGLDALTIGKRHSRDASRHWATKVNQLVK